MLETNPSASMEDNILVSSSLPLSLTVQYFSVVIRLFWTAMTFAGEGSPTTSTRFVTNVPVPYRVGSLSTLPHVEL